MPLFRSIGDKTAPCRTRRRAALAWLVLFLAVAAAPWSAPEARAGESAPSGPSRSAADGFTFYSIIRTNPGIDNLDYGFDASLPIVYAGALWPEGADKDEPDPAFIERVLRERYASDPPAMLVINVEHWPVHAKLSADLRAESIRKYRTVLEAARRALPGVRMGLYSVLPVREYWIPVRGGDDQLAAWAAANRQLAELADHVDFIAPSLYTFYRDRAGWEQYARANIQAARTYGKPVYPFLWPVYHQSNKLIGMTVIEHDYFSLQLRVVRELADGVVVWNVGRRTPALPEAWFEKTRRVIESIR